MNESDNPGRSEQPANRFGRALRSSVQSGAAGLWYGSVLGIVLLAMTDFHEQLRAGTSLAGRLGLSALLYAAGVILDRGLNVGLGIAVLGALWGFVIPFLKTDPSAALSKEPWRWSWSRILVIFVALFLMKVWPTPYACVLNDQGQVNFSQRRIRVLNRIQHYNWGSHRWEAPSVWNERSQDEARQRLETSDDLQKSAEAFSAEMDKQQQQQQQMQEFKVAKLKTFDEKQADQ